MCTWQFCECRQGSQHLGGGDKDQLLPEAVIPSSHPVWEGGPKSVDKGEGAQVGLELRKALVFMC